eukprot:1053982-Rhodomonas_salina.3
MSNARKSRTRIGVPGLHEAPYHREPPEGVLLGAPANADSAQCDCDLKSAWVPWYPGPAGTRVPGRNSYAPGTLGTRSTRQYRVMHTLALVPCRVRLSESGTLVPGYKLSNSA